MKTHTIQFSAEHTHSLDVVMVEVIRICLAAGLNVRTEQENFRLHIQYDDNSDLPVVHRVIRKCGTLCNAFVFTEIAFSAESPRRYS